MRQMMFDDWGEHDIVLDVRATAAEIGRRRGSKTLHRSAVRRLWRVGARGVQLPSRLVGGRRVTTLRAIEWWIAATNAAAVGVPSGGSVVAPLTSAERRALEEAGCG